MLRIDWLKIAVTVAVVLTAAVLFATLESRRQIRDLPPLGRPATGPKLEESIRDQEHLHRGETP